jgi:hypothetical protein
MKNPLPKRVHITIIVLAVLHVVLSEVCGRGDAALVVLGAGSLAKAPAIAEMAVLILCRLALFLVVPGWVMARLCSGMIRNAA